MFGQVIGEEGGRVLLNTSVIICDDVMGFNLLTLKEEIRIWINELIGILWSCVNDEGKGQHDEAVVLFSLAHSDKHFSENEEDYAILMRMLKNEVVDHKYLSEQMISEINWTKAPARAGNKTDLFEYASRRSGSSVGCHESQLECRAKITRPSNITEDTMNNKYTRM